MPTELQIMNQALLRVGAEQITSPDDTTERARAVKAAWVFVRPEVLRAHSWNSVTVRATLTANITAPDWGFATAYDIPADCLRVMEVDTDYDWRVEGDQIVTDATGDLKIRYLKDESDEAEFDSILSEVMALRLAVEIVERITDSTTKRRDLREEYDDLLADAMGVDGEEQSPAEFEEDDWLRVRR